MNYQTIPIKINNVNETAYLTLYLQDSPKEMGIRKRPIILICPGGAYFYVSERESEPIAMQIMAMGYHAAVLRYSVEPCRFPVQLTELALSIKMLRENAEKWNIQSNMVFVAGFSAGGHLAASLAVFWNRDWLVKRCGISQEMKELLHPDGLILGYPVITSGEYAHKDSFRYLLGNELEEKKDQVSLEKHVGSHVPPAFIWHTDEDVHVPAENSLLFVMAMRRNHIPVEFHLYEHGNHGLALATELSMGADGSSVCPSSSSWIGLLYSWIETFRKNWN